MGKRGDLPPTKDAEVALMLSRLCQGWALERLSDIDLSVVPPWMVDGLATASRMEHSLAVAHLAWVAADRMDLDAPTLVAAGVLHDAGCGPFPHVSDELMRIMLGVEGHEENLWFVLSKSPDGEAGIVDRVADLDEVLRAVAGRGELGPLMNGSIDLDNADNIYRYITTMPGRPLGSPGYLPTEVATSAELEGGALRVPGELARRWAEARARVYSYLEGHDGNISAWTMLGRAMRILEGELDEEFLLATNREAFEILREEVPELARGLTRGRYVLLDRRDLDASGLGEMCGGGRADWESLSEVEERLSSELGVPDWAIGVEALRSKAVPPWERGGCLGFLVVHRDYLGPVRRVAVDRDLWRR